MRASAAPRRRGIFSAAAARAGQLRINSSSSVAVDITNIPAFHRKRFAAIIFFAAEREGFSTNRVTR